MSQPGRNDSCPCGSGSKYKRCCLEKDEAARSAELVRRAAEAAAATSTSPDAPDTARGPTGARPAVGATPKVKQRPAGGGPPGARRRAV